jgi:hypothetical protein
MLRSCYQLIIVAIHRRQGGRKAESEGDDIRVGEGGGGGRITWQYFGELRLMLCPRLYL